MADPVPTRKTSEAVLNDWNVKLRSSPVYQNFLKSQGIDQSKPVGLSRSQQGALEKVLKANGMAVPGGMHIDNAGNLNSKNRLARNTAIAAGIAAGGYFAAPAIMGAMGAGAAGGGAGAAGLGAAAVPSLGVTGGLAAGAFPAIAGTTGGALAGLGGAAAGAGALGAGASALGGGTAAGAGGVGAGTLGTAGSGLTTLGKLQAMGGKLQDVSQMAGATSAGRAAGRAAESQLLDARDRTATDRFQTEQAAQMSAGQQDLERKGFTEQVRGSRAKQAAIADMLANFKPTNISTPGIAGSTISGGMQMGAGAQQAMAKLREQALLAQLKGDTPGGEQFTGGNILKPQAMSEVPQANGYDKFLNVASGLGGLASAYGMKKAGT